jgi:hypothetical protein
MLITAVTLLATLAPTDAPAPSAVDTACQPQVNYVPLQGRKSPLDSLTFKIGQHAIKICYGRPSSRGRTMIGGEGVPYGKLWRTGANEPTIIITPVALSIAGVAVPAGTYSLYTIPGEKDWHVIVNRATSQWGHEQAYTAEVKAQEVGHGIVKSEQVKDAVETFTIRTEPANAKTIVLEWEKSRVRIPVAAR